MEAAEETHRLRLRAYTDARRKLEDRCKSCQGDRYGHVKCANTDCEIFFSRFHEDRRVAEEREIVEALEFLRIDDPVSNPDYMEI